MKRALLTLLAALAVASPASAAQITVTTTADGGGLCPPTRPGSQCTLRTAISVATAADTISLPTGTYTVNPQFGALSLDGDVNIIGAGAQRTSIVGSGSTRVFEVSGSPNRIEGVTISGGVATNGTGGNVLMGHGADLVLDHVRITRGLAARGGGVATGGGGSLIVRHSLIDANEARTSGQIIGDGGGVLMTSTDNAQTLEVTDTTIVANKASRGAGLAASNQTGNATLLQRVTIADNAATGSRGGGIEIIDNEPVTIEDSIIVRNTGNVGAASVVIGPSNCGGFAVRTSGGNVESGTDCRLELQNTTAGLATALADAGGQTPTLALPWTSPAHDFAGACTGITDQRDVARPQGAGCDPGAFEAQPPPPPAEPTPTPNPIATTVPTPTPTVTPTPKVNDTIVVAPARGTVLVKEKGAKTFEKLDVTKGIKVGATVDVRKGRVTLTSVPKAGAPPETATFYDGIFKVTQSKGITNLTLVEQLSCPKKSRASSAAKKVKKRKLWGDGKGAFRTSGKYSAATVRGTKWLVQDTCTSTLTRVTQGSVSVRDGKRTIIVRPGRTSPCAATSPTLARACEVPHSPPHSARCADDRARRARRNVHPS